MLACIYNAWSLMFNETSSRSSWCALLLRLYHNLSLGTDDFPRLPQSEVRQLPAMKRFAASPQAVPLAGDVGESTGAKPWLGLLGDSLGSGVDTREPSSSPVSRHLPDADLYTDFRRLPLQEQFPAFELQLLVQQSAWEVAIDPEAGRRHTISTTFRDHPAPAGTQAGHRRDSHGTIRRRAWSGLLSRDQFAVILCRMYNPIARTGQCDLCTR